jgi:hypothetical protein
VPAYEWAFGDVNPPVHAWAAWRVYKIEKRVRGTGTADRAFLESAFHKLLLNFTWWVNRKDAEGMNIFQGGCIVWLLGLIPAMQFQLGRRLLFEQTLSNVLGRTTLRILREQQRSTPFNSLLRRRKLIR